MIKVDGAVGPSDDGYPVIPVDTSNVLIGNGSSLVYSDVLGGDDQELGGSDGGFELDEGGGDNDGRSGIVFDIEIDSIELVGLEDVDNGVDEVIDA